MLLILIFRQTSLGLGWIEERDSSNQKEIAPGIETLRIEHFRFFSQYQPNPCLIDLPPPVRTA
ncbi:MAG: hypothetical protein KAS29_02370 [Bacteroidales bacterium]|nr:hypothetical protein [Bacteroidales bacterium]